MRLPIDLEETPGSQIGLSLLVTVEEAATLLRIGRTTANELVMRGALQSVKVGRRRLVVREGLDRFISGLLALPMDD
jgi:excisionase family DNA binding protein